MEPPSFAWVPSHLELEDAPLNTRAPFLWVLGNAWADYFAKAGASDIAVSQVLADVHRMALKEAKLFARYVSWAVAHRVELAKATEPDQHPPSSSQALTRSPPS